MKYLKFIFPLFLILFSCSPNADDSVENTRLELTVLDESSAAIENVEVKLYASQEDYDNDINIIATATTNANGKVIFENLQPITYYWKTTIDCYFENAIYSTLNPISGNRLNLFSTVLESDFFGSMIIINHTTYNHSVSFTGPDNGSANSVPGLNVIIEGLPTGVYSLIITPLEGPITAPIYQTITLECGSYTDIQID